MFNHTNSCRLVIVAETETAGAAGACGHKVALRREVGRRPDRYLVPSTPLSSPGSPGNTEMFSWTPTSNQTPATRLSVYRGQTVGGVKPPMPPVPRCGGLV